MSTLFPESRAMRGCASLRRRLGLHGGTCPLSRTGETPGLLEGWAFLAPPAPRLTPRAPVSAQPPGLAHKGQSSTGQVRGCRGGWWGSRGLTSGALGSGLALGCGDWMRTALSLVCCSRPIQGPVCAVRSAEESWDSGQDAATPGSQFSHLRNGSVPALPSGGTGSRPARRRCCLLVA